MVELTDNCAECGGIFTIGDWAELYVDGWIHRRCRPRDDGASHLAGPDGLVDMHRDSVSPEELVP